MLTINKEESYQRCDVEVWFVAFLSDLGPTMVIGQPFLVQFLRGNVPLCPSSTCSWGKVQCSIVRQLFEAQDRVLKTKFGSLGRRPPTPFI